MKIRRFYWDTRLQRQVCDLVFTVKRETKTQLIAQTPNYPDYNWRFRKPKQIANGVRVWLIGNDRFSMFNYELWIE